MATTAASFATTLVPDWLKIAMPAGDAPAPICESIDGNGNVIPDQPITTLAQGRTALMLAHLYLATGDEALLTAAKRITSFMTTYLGGDDGGYRYSVAPDGSDIDTPASRQRRTYDQSFALLALVTLQKAAPDAVTDAQIESCISYVENILTDPVTGALWEDDDMARDGAKPGDLRAQNPHMHMFEAVMQAYEMTGNSIWLKRAKTYMDLGARYFIDPNTGAICEFIGHDLTQSNAGMGGRREPGHQFEWAWLLNRYAELSGDDAPRALADRMREFVETHGIRPNGPMAGAAYDAVGPAGDVTEATHLLWPLTEAGKVYAAITRETGDAEAATRATELADMIFGDYFADDKPAWINQLDDTKTVVWNEGLTRLLYHVAFFITEGGRAGLWSVKG